MSINPALDPLPIIPDPPGEPRQAGELTVTRQGVKIQLPLAKIDVTARVKHGIAGVTVRQTFRNPYAEPLEAVYIFPLGGGCVVRDFVLTAGGRELRGDVKERLEAQADYARAIDEGRRAALLEKERDDVFTVTLGNLPPGEEATVDIAYSELLDAGADGTEELRLPFVVAPRYIPGQAIDGEGAGQGVELDTDLVPDASRITPPRLAPGLTADLEVAVAVEIEASAMANLSCTQHATRTSVREGVVRVELARTDERANRDFVLRWRAERTGAVGARCLVHVGEGTETYGVLSIEAPAAARNENAPRDVVFVLDRSGSMEGAKMASASRACALLLDGLGPSDRYAILAFDTAVEWYERSGSRLVRADEAGRRAGAAHLRSIGSRGGTEMHGALVGALAEVAARGETNRDAVVVLITDGEIGDESRVTAEAQQQLGATRLFTVGIDTAVNSGFLKRIAKLGRGTSAFVEPGADLDRALVAIGREIGRPAVVDLRVTTDTGEALEAAPELLPDVFEGRRASIFFRAQTRAGKLHVRGRLSSGGEFSADVVPEQVAFEAIPHLWARERIVDLEDRYRIGVGDKVALKVGIIGVSIAHRILSRFTAFVVVDDGEIVNKDGALRTVVQPVEMPQQWASAPDLMMAMPSAPRAMSSWGASLASKPYLGDEFEQKLEQPGSPAIGRLGGLLGRRSRSSLDGLLKELRELVEKVAEALQSGGKVKTKKLAKALAKFEASMTSSESQHRRISDAVKALIAAIDAKEDATTALAEARAALSAKRLYWESSI